MQLIEKNRVERALLDAEISRSPTVTIETDALRELLNPEDDSCQGCEDLRGDIEAACDNVRGLIDGLESFSEDDDAPVIKKMVEVALEDAESILTSLKGDR